MKKFKLLLSVIFYTKVLEACRIFSGPVGEKQCLSVTGYTGYQWATCLPSKYISDKTSGRHKCNYQFSKFCYYQCETEVNAKPSGPVGSQCSCDASNAVIAPTLENWCYIPDTGRCDWYHQCLQKSYTCQPGNLAFNTSLDDATSFCSIDQTQFSKNVKVWIDGVRRCLLAEMLLLLRMTTLSCQSAIDKYTTSLQCCYLAGPTCSAPPSLGSICTLNWQELSELLISKSIDILLKSTIYNIAHSKCKADTFISTRSVNEVFNLRFEFKRYSPNTVGTNTSSLSKEFLTNFKCYNSEFHDFDENNISYDFFPMVQDSNKQDRAAIGMILSTNENSTYFNETLDRLYKDYVNGSLSFGVKISDGAVWQLQSLSNCKNVKCTEHYWIVKLIANMTTPQSSYCHRNKTLANFNNHTLTSHSQVMSFNSFVNNFVMFSSIMIIFSNFWI